MAVVRTQEERDQQTVDITRVLLAGSILWPIPFLMVFAVAETDLLGPVPMYPLLFAAYLAAVLLGLRLRGHR